MDKAILKHKFNTIVQNLAELVLEAGTDIDLVYSTCEDKLSLRTLNDEIIAEHGLLIDRITD